MKRGQFASGTYTQSRDTEKAEIVGKKSHEKSVSCNGFSELPFAEVAFPGPLRDRFVDAIVYGRKGSTTRLALEYAVEQVPLPQPGQRFVVVDSNPCPIAIIVVTSVLVIPLGDVDFAHAVDEGEGHMSVHAWRTSHETLWHSKEMRTALGDPTFQSMTRRPWSSSVLA